MAEVEDKSLPNNENGGEVTISDLSSVMTNFDGIVNSHKVLSTSANLTFYFAL